MNVILSFIRSQLVDLLVIVVSMLQLTATDRTPLSFL